MGLHGYRLWMGAFAGAGFFLAGCLGGDGARNGIVDTGVEVPFSGKELPNGAYPILKDFDDFNRYEQYFIVRPGGEWEFAEFGRRKTDTVLVRLTRQIGVYDLRGDTLVMGVTHEGEMEANRITEAMIAAFPFKRILAPTGNFLIRNLLADRFSAKDLFVGNDGWKTYVLGKLPSPVAAPAIGTLPRVFGPPLFKVYDTLRLIEGEPYDLDLAGTAPNPNTAMYFLHNDYDHATDSARGGHFTIRPGEGYWEYEAWARDAAGVPSARKIITVVGERVRPKIARTAWSEYHVEDTVSAYVAVTDPQNDLAEIAIDYDGDGVVDARAAQAQGLPAFTYHQPGQYLVSVTARDQAGHADSLSFPIQLKNDNPKIARDTLYLDNYLRWEHYRREPWKGIVHASDREKNLIDSVWWDFDADGKIDTVSPLRDTLVRTFDIEGIWESKVMVKDRAGGWDTASFHFSVQPFKPMSQPYFPADAGQTPFAYKNRLWVLGGTSSTIFTPNILSSADGAEWKVEVQKFSPGPGTQVCHVLELGGKLFLFSEDYYRGYRETWTSADGLAWTLSPGAKPWSDKSDPIYVVFQDKLWVFAGQFVESGKYRMVAWNSADGSDWKSVDVGEIEWLQGAPFITVWNGKLFLLMTFYTTSTEEFYYTSADGVAWTGGKFTPPWKSRVPADLLAYRGKLWLLGGDGAVWKSPDGLTWQRQGRGDLITSGNHAAVFDDKLFWISGRQVYMTED